MSKTEEAKAQLLCTMCSKDLIWRKSRSEFSTLLKMTPCWIADRWPHIIHPDHFLCIFIQTHNPTLDWQGPVACHLLAVFVTRACISCLRAVLLGTPFITHSDTTVTQTAYHMTSYLHIFQIVYSLTSRVKQFDNSNCKEKLATQSFNWEFPQTGFISSRNNSQSLGNGKKSAWIKTEQLLEVCFANASLWISYRAQ